jgi:hypothetical protein
MTFNTMGLMGTAKIMILGILRIITLNVMGLLVIVNIMILSITSVLCT